MSDRCHVWCLTTMVVTTLRRESSIVFLQHAYRSGGLARCRLLLWPVTFTAESMQQSVRMSTWCVKNQATYFLAPPVPNCSMTWAPSARKTTSDVYSCRWRSLLTACRTPNLPTKIIPTKIAGLKLSGKLPMGLGIPPLRIKIMIESNPLKSIILVRRLAVRKSNHCFLAACRKEAAPLLPALAVRRAQFQLTALP